ncbi:MAG: coproporphyrinogen dehydrogenase HemZ [Eubacteriales bacterium]|nr:coproporphyrinogen dehydrogenase HemZ [Eubacteriales bacterium]MDD3199509.1 coproporphyrinogen dehydrogenase HemZ [Eubacteriales bacterium]MDD4630462.1 coproporphyrinogen dehydrogenase HemZ [Eubacteriales bacterium]
MKRRAILLYRICLPEGENKYEFEELIKVFLKSGEYEIDQYKPDDKENRNSIYVPAFSFSPEDIAKKEKDTKNKIKRFLFRELQRQTGKTPDWGILTGVRPVKLAGELLDRENSARKVKDILIQDYYLTPGKAGLLLDIVDCQRKVLQKSDERATGIYIGIPFCPTRCVYCSFPSNQGKAESITEYLPALHREITFVSENMTSNGWYPETLYIGGGTPTILTAEQLDNLLSHTSEAFDLKKIKEFTVEAGRPDTITAQKVKVLQKHNINRISINPQSMNIKTLERIGRAHQPEDIADAFMLAKDSGIPVINMDIIAGLPEEDESDFAYTLDAILRLAPENITVHTLALKRASRLKEIDSEYSYKQGNVVRAMLDHAKEKLNQAGYHPYYLYRQKQMTGNFENIGYAKGNTEGIYNIRIMEEAQTIIALGAGGISKVYFPEENRLERVANVSNYEIYIERLNEMLQRKIDNLFHVNKEA